MLAALPLLFLFDHFGKSALAIPALGSVGMVAIAIWLRWRLRRHVWFWLTMTVFAALHVFLLLLLPWTDKRVPTPVVIPIGLADLYTMLVIIYVVQKFIGGTKTNRNNCSREIVS